MLSQSDIIKALINNNCADKSVLATALSSDCTSTRLIEKLIEAERLDIALDISMKLGLDVMPFWRTLAMRCLQNCNFQQAREKFRHCFLRLKLPSGRSSPAQSKLLNDILSTLVKLEESRIPLSEEVSLIKQGVYTQDDRADQVTNKPRIYDECKYYLTEYGNTEDVIEFNIRNSLWNEASAVMIDKISQIHIERFFIRKILLFVVSTGKLSNLLEAFLNLDPKIVLSSKYFKSVYSWCSKGKRYNSLLYIQSKLGDHIGAAETLIIFFFLKKPMTSYKDLNQRLTYLKSARKNYQTYLDSLEIGDPKEVHSRGPELFGLMSKEQVRERLKLIDWQIDITSNFAINEISGSYNGIEVDFWTDSDKSSKVDDTPVTLFDKDVKPQTFIAALVLVYYDITCSSYFSKSGLDLANNLMDRFKLERTKVFKTAMRVILEDESCDNLEYAGLLLERLREDYRNNTRQYQNEIKSNSSCTKTDENQDQDVGLEHSEKNTLDLSISNRVRASHISNKVNQINAQTICDDVIRDSIGSCREPDYKMELAKLLSGEAKIELYIQSGKLSNAQRLACNMNRPDYVSSIIKEATKLNQNHVKTVCQLWLANYETRNFIR